MLVCKLWHIQCKHCPAQASVAAAMATGVANRVLYKMALVPMGNYVFVLSQFQTFGYLLVYFGILATRYRCAVLLFACCEYAYMSVATHAHLHEFKLH